MQLEAIRQAIREDAANQAFTDQGLEPLFQAPATARILIIGQAPGLKTQGKGRLFDDASGVCLRRWLGVDEATFYESGLFAILPMDFYYPGRGKSGDLPPRKDFAGRWHPLLMSFLPEVELTIFLGRYAQDYYLGTSPRILTHKVRQAASYLPSQCPLPHPSPRNAIWQAKNPWFQTAILPLLRERVSAILQVAKNER